MGLSIARVRRELLGQLRSFLVNVPHGAGGFVVSAPSAAGLRDHRGRSGDMILAVMTRGTLPPGFNEIGVPTPLRPKGFEFPVHRILLGNNVLIAENVTNLGSVIGKRTRIMALPLRVKGSDAGHARIIAEVLN